MNQLVTWSTAAAKVGAVVPLQFSNIPRAVCYNRATTSKHRLAARRDAPAHVCSAQVHRSWVRTMRLPVYAVLGPNLGKVGGCSCMAVCLFFHRSHAKRRHNTTFTQTPTQACEPRLTPAAAQHALFASNFCNMLPRYPPTHSSESGLVPAMRRGSIGGANLDRACKTRHCRKEREATGSQTQTNVMAARLVKNTSEPVVVVGELGERTLSL